MHWVILLLEMIGWSLKQTRVYPHNSNDPQHNSNDPWTTLFYNIANCKRSPIPQETTPILQRIITCCLKKDPAHRITTEGLLALMSNDQLMNNTDPMLAELQLMTARSWHLDYIKTLVTYRPECLNKPDKQGIYLIA